MLNKAMLIGRLGKDPEVKNTSNDSMVANFTVATDEKSKIGGEWKTQTTWHNIVAWGRTAEFAAKYLTKGSKVYLEGRIQNRSYQDKDDNTKYISEIVAFTVQGLDSKKKETEEAPVKSKAADDDIPW